MPPQKETSLKPPPFLEVLVPRKDRERSYICLLGVSILPLSEIVSIGFWNCSGIVVFLLFFFIIKFRLFLNVLEESLQKKQTNKY